jgi:hypothetical protein
MSSEAYNIFSDGMIAYMNGLPRTPPPYLPPHRKAAWLRGWDHMARAK